MDKCFITFGLGISTPKVSGSKQVGFNSHSLVPYISRDMSTAHNMFNPCSLGRWQFVNSLFTFELTEHHCFSNADFIWTEKRAKKLFTVA